jgi:hypothetical protein
MKVNEYEYQPPPMRNPDIKESTSLVTDVTFGLSVVGNFA